MTCHWLLMLGLLFTHWIVLCLWQMAALMHPPINTIAGLAHLAVPKLSS